MRGRGLMLGFRVAEAGRPPRPRRAAAGRGLIVNPIGADTIRLLPPLVIGEAEVDEALEIVRRVLD